eukprot:Blabericola_migrator_1__201@NODE_1053_length_5578_cov_106_651424_g724_i0_p1_GENE_NODE_1053_length_5578_cov_106_651424_g724_i0NODE_1053_length_5578_cov_106_651424_g724_i0_p1_ORF_typecomplete_len688_score76_82Zona_pellucida/PF00100_23/0_00012_NODE_1053_length_5578_cov_106_651424_g724_i0612124
MGVAVPVRKRTLKHLPPGSVEKHTENGPFHIFPQSESLWEETPRPGSYCRSGSAPSFFKGNKRRKAAAFLGETALNSCGTASVVVGSRIYYSNVFSPPGNPSVLVTCMCSQTKAGTCHPSARWLPKDIKHHHEDDSAILGHLLSVRSLTGQNSDIEVTSTEDRYAFQFQVPKAATLFGTPWPITCVAESPEGKSIPMMVGGCPVSKDMDMRVHNSTQPWTTVISTMPFGFAGARRNRTTHLKCQLDILNISAEEALGLCYTPMLSSADVQAELLEMETREEPLRAVRRRLESARPKKPEVTLPILKASILHSPSPNTFDGHDPAEIFAKQTEIETQSRIKSLQSAVSEGEFGDLREAIVKAEYAVSEDPSSLTRKTEQLFTDLGPLTADQVIPQLYNQYVVGPWAVSWGANARRGSAETAIANPGGYGYGGATSGGRNAYFGVGTRGNNLQVGVDESAQRAYVGFAKNRYGVMVDRSDIQRSTATEIRARGTDLVSQLDFLDRLIGQRVGVRNFGLQARADLDQLSSDSESADFGSELYFQYKTIGVGLGSSLLSSRYIVSIGMMGVNVAVARDFNAFASNLQVNWGRGWQVFVEADMPDDYNLGYQQAVGIGKPGRMYLAVGAGTAIGGLPVAAVNIHHPVGQIGAGFIERASERVAQFSITVGRFTYLWESILLPDNLPVSVALA